MSLKTFVIYKLFYENLNRLKLPRPLIATTFRSWIVYYFSIGFSQKLSQNDGDSGIPDILHQKFSFCGVLPAPKYKLLLYLLPNSLLIMQCIHPAIQTYFLPVFLYLSKKKILLL